MIHPTALERAFELARSGRYPTIDQIKQKLKSEGLDQIQVEGPVLRRQLREAMADAQLTPIQSSVTSVTAETSDRR